jgi:hypothetical protein
MKKMIVLIIGMIIILPLGCSSKPDKPADVIKRMQSLYGSGKNDEARSFFTKGTLNAIGELNKLAPQSRGSEYGVDKIFSKGAKWAVVSEKINGDTSELRIKYTDHPVENMKGSEMAFRMRKEDGMWKCDMENDLLESMKLIREMRKKIK